MKVITNKLNIRAPKKTNAPKSIKIRYTRRKMNKRNPLPPKHGFSTFVSSISDKTIFIMNLLLLPLTVSFIYIGIEFYKTACVNILMAKDSFMPIFEHLLATLLIVFGGAMVLDLTIKEVNR